MNTRLESTLALPLTHPVFEGHFPGHPIVPGALILDEVVRLLATHTGATGCTVRSAKFVHPASPGDALQVELAPTASGGFDFRVVHGDTLIAAGTLQAD